MVKHGARVKITEARLEQVEAFFERRGGATILIGRFIGLVRAIAPFIAGASKMPLRKFLPYDMLGAGLWATTFCVLGYVFWQLVRPAHRVGVARAVRVRPRRRGDRRDRLPDPAAAQPGAARAHEGVDRRAARQAAPAPGRAVPARGLGADRPAARRARSEAPARFVWNRFTPGELGLEVTTLLAVAAVGSFVFFLLGSELDERDLLVGDRVAADLADRLYNATVADVVELVTAPRLARRGGGRARRHDDLGRRRAAASSTRRCCRSASRSPTPPSTSPRTRYDRPRPADPLVDAEGSAYPSAHAAYSVGWVACAVVLVRGGEQPGRELRGRHERGRARRGDRR